MATTSTNTQAQTRARSKADEDAQATIRRRNTTRIIQRVLIYALLILIALIVLVPLAWMISTSFQTEITALFARYLLDTQTYLIAELSKSGN